MRVDTHLYQGYTVPAFYDSLLAKVIVWDIDRRSCIAAQHPLLTGVRAGGFSDDSRPAS